MFRHLKLLKYLHEINLSPTNTLALLRRLETDSCRGEDYAVLIRIVRAHTELVGDFVGTSPVAEPSVPARQATRQHQGSKRARHPRRWRG